MWNTVNHIKGAKVIATDGQIGHVTEVYFDQQKWTIRYLVVATGGWLSGRDVLISPYAVRPPMGDGKSVHVALTRQKVQDSPPIDTHQPISRRHEQEMLSYYTFPAYWQGVDLWYMSALPLLPAPLPDSVEAQAEIEARENNVPAEDVYLSSSAAVTGYDIQASDDSIGHVADFIYDDESWAIRYLVVDTRNWWPGGRKVLLATPWINRVDWAEKTVYTPLTREQVKNSPEYEEGKLDREYEKRLHQAYERSAYWE